MFKAVGVDADVFPTISVMISNTVAGSNLQARSNKCLSGLKHPNQSLLVIGILINDH